MSTNKIKADDRLSWFKGNQEALDLYNATALIAEMWDNLIDKDKEVSDEDVHKLMNAALIGLPLNPFFLKHNATFYPLLITSAASYVASTKLEKSSDPLEVEHAHMLRFSIYMMPLLAAILAGGLEHGIEMMVKCATTMMPEGVGTFLKEKGHVSNSEE